MWLIDRVRGTFDKAAHFIDAHIPAILYENTPEHLAYQLRKLDEGLVYHREEGAFDGKFVKETDSAVLATERESLKRVLQTVTVYTGTYDNDGGIV